MDIHFVRNGQDTIAACGLLVLLADENDYFSTRHDQATCRGCVAAF